MKKFLSTACAFAFVVGANAQHFRWKAPLDAADSTGYTRVLLEPEVTGALREGFPDLRLYDDSGNQIPYFHAFDQIVAGSTRFEEYPVIDKNDEPDDCWITVENPLYPATGLDHLCLEVNNNYVQRKMSLTGSYDNEHWFALKDEYSPTSFETFGDGSVSYTNVVRFDFPKSNYHYFRFRFNNWSEWWQDYQAPVFVVRAGILVKTNEASVEKQQLELPGVSTTRAERGKTTCISIVFADSQYVDYMRFEFTCQTPPGTFHRAARLYLDEDSVHSCITDQPAGFLSASILSAGNLNEFSVGNKKVKQLCLHIENEDNRPLDLIAVHPIQLRHHIIAYLEKGKNYYFLYGNDTLGYPSYDIKLTNDNIATYRMKTIGTGLRESSPPPPKQPEIEKSESFFKNKLFIWSSMGIVVLILGYMSVKMLREMKSSRETIDERQE